jgi:hypothetical protein
VAHVPGDIVVMVDVVPRFTDDQSILMGSTKSSRASKEAAQLHVPFTGA